jgi:CxxC motif-containing protein (DUF1111 family)
MFWSRIAAITVLMAVPLAAAANDIAAGGATTHDATNRHAFSLPAANMPMNRVRDFFFGNHLFKLKWAIATPGAEAFDGLGPTYNNVSCSGCHVRDGRGRPPENLSDRMDSMLLRISLPGSGPHGQPRPHPIYGAQVQNRAILGVSPEAQVTISTTVIEGSYGDGTPYKLKKPTYQFHDFGFGHWGNDVLFSPRVAPAVFGLGLLEAVPEQTLARMADPDDVNGDGISGRRNIVFDKITGAMRTGRFGWKASQPSLRQQNSAAFHSDMGITTLLFPDENCPVPQKKCKSSIHGGAPEAAKAFMDKLTFYTESLGVPGRRDASSPKVARGELLFDTIGCSACHRPVLAAGFHANPIISNQRFAPYTDLLLHDMGDALADNQPDFRATGREWRTPPLWGLGLIPAVNKHHRLLHDGRANGPAEAILWHAGEARNARERFRTLPTTDRDALIAFLNSL